MKATTVDGAIIDVFGPFQATLNDSDILKLIFESTSILNMFSAGDVVLVDRGFRDCVTYLRNKKIDVRIPEFIEKGTNGQLSTKKCNKSRHITKMLYIIEQANGRMKNKWQLFQKIIPSILNRQLMQDYKIGAALLNAFSKPMICDEFDFVTIGEQMISRLDSKNELQQIIRSNAFRKSELKYFKIVDSNQLEFPKFNQEQIKLFSLGTYAIRQAISYVAEHKTLHDGQFEALILPTVHVWAHFGRICAKENFEKPMLISSRIRSRFRGQKIHKAYVLYDSSDFYKKSNLFYMCTCQHGLRTVGCCSHVMSIVWYFSYGRFEIDNFPASHHNNFFASSF